jgi:hypothetical protein
LRLNVLSNQVQTETLGNTRTLNRWKSARTSVFDFSRLQILLPAETEFVYATPYFSSFTNADEGTVLSIRARSIGITIPNFSTGLTQLRHNHFPVFKQKIE